MAEAAREFKALGAVPFSGAVTDPCDGRTQGTTGMFDSLPYRNDAAIVFRRLIRSLPTRKGVLGVATCDKGLPAMMMALAANSDLPTALVPGGVTLLPEDGEDAGKIQSLGARFAHQQITLDYAAEVGCRTCASPGGGCQFLGTAATSQVVAEALGLALPHTALGLQVSRFGWMQPTFSESGVATVGALVKKRCFDRCVVAECDGGACGFWWIDEFTATCSRDCVCGQAEASELSRLDRNQSSNSTAGGCFAEWATYFATVQVFLAGGVPEVMLHLRGAGLIDTSSKDGLRRKTRCLSGLVEGKPPPVRISRSLEEVDGIDPDDVIMSPDRANFPDLRLPFAFPWKLAPEGSVIRARQSIRGCGHRRRLPQTWQGQSL